MKVSNQKLESTSFVHGNDSTGMVKRKEKTHPTLIIDFLPIFSMLITIFPGILNRSPGINIIKIGLLTLILTTAASFFIRMNIDHILNKRLAKTIITISYLLSICLIFVERPEIISFWMLGGLVVAMLIDTRLGLLIHFNLSFILGISMSLRPETVIYLLVIGVLMSILSTSLKQKSTVIYASIILLSTNITLSFVINNFIFNTNANYNYLSSFFSIFAVLVTAFLLCLLYDRYMMKTLTEHVDSLEEDEIINEMEEEKNTSATVIYNEKADTLKEALSSDDKQLVSDTFKETDKVSVQNHLAIRTSYELLNQENNVLLSKLKDYSKDLYEHALQIGMLSSRAALAIGADEMLAKAGGLYHEIGKINGKNYIEEGIKLADEYSFPKEVTLILKQHNIKYEKPTSVEAAIVMLSDNVVSTIDYIDKTEDYKFTTNKIIDNIFQMRMEKGTFDNSGLSVKDYKKLKEFYQKEFNTKKEIRQ